MIQSFAEYQSYLTKTLSKLPDEKRIRFARQVAQRLSDQYQQYLSRDGFQKEAELVQLSLDLLADMADQTEVKATPTLENYLARLYDAGYVINVGLDLSEVHLLGRDQLIQALQYAIAYLLDKKVKHLVGCAFCPFEVVTLQLVKEGLDMGDRDQHIGHPLFREERAFQTALLLNS